MISSASFPSRVSIQPVSFSSNRLATIIAQCAKQVPSIQFGKDKNDDWAYRLGLALGNLWNFITFKWLRK